MQVLLPLVIKACDEYQGWPLLSRWSVCEVQSLACLWYSSGHFLWPLVSNIPVFSDSKGSPLHWPARVLSFLAQTSQLCSAELLELMFSFIQRTTVKIFGGPPPSSMHEIICICDSFYPVKLQTPVQRRTWRRLKLGLLTDWVHQILSSCAAKSCLFKTGYHIKHTCKIKVKMLRLRSVLLFCC